VSGHNVFPCTVRGMSEENHLKRDMDRPSSFRDLNRTASEYNPYVSHVIQPCPLK
jgi:hypothetical protein